MKTFCLCLFAALFGTAVAADQPAKAVADARADIARKFPGTRPEDVKASPLSGIYEVQIGADIAYVSADGKYLIAGDLFEVDTRTNLTETGRTALRSKTLAKLDERDMIVFAPAVVKYTITVFTDVECGYCRKLHSQIDELNKLGVAVRYMAYPRAGPGTDDWRKMEAVWCSKDRRSAITQAKQGQELKTANCGANPVAKQFQLGEDLGVRGTPAIFTPAGDYIGGYLPPSALVEQLNVMKNDAAAKNEPAAKNEAAVKNEAATKK